MAFDVLAEFASASERQTLLSRHRMSLLGMGVITGMMGAAPSLVWASGALFVSRFCDLGALGDLDLHPGFCVCFFVVCALRLECLARPAPGDTASLCR
jgi:hypothetical protein